MPIMQDDDGDLWEVDASGNVIGPAKAPAPQQQGRVFTLPPNPKDQRQEARQAAADARAAEDQARQNRKDARDALEFNATHNPDGSPKARATGASGDLKVIPGAAAGGIQENLNALHKIDAALAAIDEKNGRPESIGFGTGMLGQTFTNWHDPDGTDERAAVGAVGAQKIHDLSGAAVSASEAPRFVPFVPSVTDPPDVARQKLQNFRRELTGQIKESIDFYSPANGYRPYETPGVRDFMAAQSQQRTPDETDKAAAIPGGYTDPNDPPPDNSPPGLPPANAPGGQDTSPLVPASGASRFEDLPPRLTSTVQSLINAGASKATVDAALKQAGHPGIPWTDWNAITKWQKAHPGAAYTGKMRQEVPLSMMQKAAGSALGSGVAQYADAATAGISTALGGDEGRGALAAMSAAHPDASAVGSVLGGITGAGAAELGAGAMLAPRFAAWAPRLGDALYGGTAGATEDGSLSGAAMGAGAGVLGGALGERALRAAGSVTRGVTNPAARYLRDQGIPLTVGQTVGDSGFLGRTVKGIEDRLAGLPVVGDMVNARRREGLEAFNQAVFRTAAAPGAQVDAIGSQGMGQLRQGVGDAYDAALDNTQIDVLNDPQMIAGMMQARQTAQAIPNVAPTFPQDFATASIDNRIQGNIDPAGMMGGRRFQEAYRGLGRDARGRTSANSDYAHEIGGALRQGQDALGEALERQNPGAFQGFIEANAANRRANVIADALRNAGNQTDELITPAQLNRADIGSTSRLQGRINSAAGNRPFYDLATHGQDVLPSKVPDSGTAGRMATAALLGGIGGAGAGGYAAGGNEGGAVGAGTGLGAILALTLGGTQGVQRAATRALLDRPDIAIQVGNELRRRAALGGAGGAGILAQIVAGQ